MLRSYLFANGDNPAQIDAAFNAGADAVVLDLEVVSFDRKARAREIVLDVLKSHPAWVRINAPWGDLANIDLYTLSEHVRGICVPRVESVADVDWVAQRAPDVRLACTIESASGVLNAPEIALGRGVTQLLFSASGVCSDIGIESSREATWVGRSRVVYSSAGAKIAPPLDGAYPHLDDDAGLRDETEFARRLGFCGKAALDPRQVAVINDVFMPSKEQIRWARAVLDACERAAQGEGDAVDLPIAERARAILDLADR